MICALFQGNEVELTYELMSDKIAQTSSSSATTQDKRPIKGADGQLASITLKFKPFIYVPLTRVSNRDIKRYKG